MHLALLAVALIWGLNVVAVKYVLRHVDPLAFTGIRFLAMTPLALCFLSVSGERLRVQRRDLPVLLACAACGYGLYQYFWAIGLAHTTAFASSLLGTTSPLFTLAFVAALGHERVRFGRWLGALAALIGVAVFEGMFSGQARFRVGDVLTLIAAAVFAGYSIISARLLTRYSPAVLFAATLIMGTALILPGGIYGLALHHDFSQVTRLDWLLFLYSVIFPIVLTYPIWSWAITRIGPAGTSLFIFAVPLVAGFASAVILHTAIPAYQIVGAGICIAGMLCAQLLQRFSVTTLWSQQSLPAEH